jgi:bacterioferritin-associated ferredoxin
VIVCSCLAVCHRTVDAVLASGAASVPEVTARCGAGGRCGGCWPNLQRLLDDHAGQRTSDAHAAA